MTDVTGFGLAGHSLEMARASGVTLRLDASQIPLLPNSETLARDGIITGASGRNWQSYRDSVALSDGLSDWQRHILTDPQTSGGLLIACEPSAAPAILKRIQVAGYDGARRIGHVLEGEAKVEVTMTGPSGARCD